MIRTALFLAAALAAAPAIAETTAKAMMKGPDGADLGSVTLTQTPNGVLVRADLKGIPEGPHGFHLHAIGACAPDFGAAGGHFAGKGEAHGIHEAKGPHGGDMPNIHVPASGALMIEVLNTGVSLEGDGADMLLDSDGAAVVIHAGADDYASQPSGAAGARIACGVVEGM